MSNINLQELFNKPRREVLLTLTDWLSDVDTLKNVVGRNVTVDCALYMLALKDETLMHNLSSVFSTEELTDDISHTINDRALRIMAKQRINEMLRRDGQ